MAATEAVGCGPEREPQPDGAVRLGNRPARRQPEQGVADVDRRAGRVDVAQPGEEVGVLAAGAHEQVCRDLAEQLEVGWQRGAGVGQHVGTGLEHAVVHSRRALQADRPAQARCGVARVVAVAVRLAGGRRLGAERPVRLQVPALRLGVRRPRRKVAPFLRAGDEDPDRVRPQEASVVEQVRPQPGHRVSRPGGHRLLVGVPPRPDGQVGLVPGAAQRGVVTQLIRQEDVVPAADHADRGGHPVQGVGEPAALPVVVPGIVVGQPVLVVSDVAAGRQPVEIAQRQPVEQRLEPVVLSRLADERESPFLARDLVDPGQRRLERERLAAVERSPEVGGRHLRAHRLELGPGVGSYRPLNHAQVARPGRGEGPWVPGLFAQPGDRGQAVVMLVGSERVEGAAGAERSTAALDQHLEASLGQHPAEQDPPDPAPPVRRADQHQRRPPVHVRQVPVGEQLHPVGHGHPQVTFDLHVVVRRGRQFHRPPEEAAGYRHRREAPKSAGTRLAALPQFILLGSRAICAGRVICRQGVSV